ncbi:hypothetical protein BU16DRAFT_565923 [Lophium mytilinum]|uniref:Uncharacterized protein n=1 Tax=Lophium mytilinum TaxID=390894 RepID=A0A6A6QFF0_9PEZI|nr:hypothetical protein BU16DRAFT_565923 [Lophium mytilinum]
MDTHTNNRRRARADKRARYNAFAPALTKLLIVACVVMYFAPAGIRYAVRDAVNFILSVGVLSLVLCLLLCVPLAVIMFITLHEEAERERGLPVGVDAGMMIERRRGMGS